MAETDTDTENPDGAALKRLQEQILGRWQAFPDDQLAALDELLRAALKQAALAKAEVLTVTSPVSRPQRLQLAPLISDATLDTMYHGEWAELAVSSDGRCFLVYRRRDGGDYAVEWSSATSLPTTMLSQLPECLALALLGDDDGNS